MKGVLRAWLVRWAWAAGTRDFCPALAALVGPVQNILFLTRHYFSSFVLDRQSCWVAFLLVCVSDSSDNYNMTCWLQESHYYDTRPHTVTRPYAGFRRPDRMAPDQTVRGGENDCFIWSGNFLAQVPKFSSILGNPGIFRRFTWSSVRGAPFLCWYFTFLDAGRHFRNFPESYPVKMRECAG